MYIYLSIYKYTQVGERLQDDDNQLPPVAHEQPGAAHPVLRGCAARDDLYIYIYIYMCVCMGSSYRFIVT